MSNPLAISAVTATFGELLKKVNEGSGLSGVTVTIGPPDLSTGTAQRINLFLYQIAQNGALANSDLPFRNPGGDVVHQPALALNLHYLVTAFGQGNDDLEAHHLLARAMAVVHDNAVLTRAQIRASMTAFRTRFPPLLQSDLADQFELVRLTPLSLSGEELSKLWTAFQTNYRISVGYEATVVIVERPRPTRAAPPVRAPAVTVVTDRRPTIESVAPQVALTGQSLTIAGRNLGAPGTVVRFATGDVPPAAVSARELTVPLPAGLRPGLTSVQVVQPLALGDPPAPHKGFESNQVPFMLAPEITTPQPISVGRGAKLTLSFRPPAGRTQRIAAVVGDRLLPPEPVPFQPPPAPPPPDPVSSLDFPIPGDFAPGTYLLRLQVDGADSPLVVDDDPDSPTFDQYVGPHVQVTA